MSIKSIYTSAIVGLAVLVCFGLAAVYAGGDDNVSGFAWSENIGWVSFNSTDCDSDGDGITDAGNFAQCPVGLAVSDYGVALDLATGNFSGYAWSEYIGWIDFAPSGPYPENPQNSAHYDSVTGEVDGWAKILSLGDNGWLKLRESNPGGKLTFPIPFPSLFPMIFNRPAFDYGVSIDAAGDFHGWAWSGGDNDSGIGWISFNGADAGAGGDYKVVLGGGAPTASNLSVSEGNSATYCGSSAGHHFSWDYSDPDGDDESRFQFQVDDNSDFSSPEVDRDYGGLSNPSPTTNNQTVNVFESPSSDQLGYNTIYDWRVRVYDSAGSDSGWVNGPSFITELHRYPLIDFDWSPLEPSAEEDVLFADQSVVYGGAVKSAWLWSFENGDPNFSGVQNPTVQFTNEGGQEVILEVTDSDSYVCSLSKIIDVQSSMPDWKEILPW